MKNRNAIGMWSWSLSIAIYFFYSLVQRTKNQKNKNTVWIRFQIFVACLIHFFLSIFKHIFQVCCAFEFSIARWCAVKQKKVNYSVALAKMRIQYTMDLLFFSSFEHIGYTHTPHILTQFMQFHCMHAVKWFRFSSGAFSLIEQHITMWKLYLSEKKPRVSRMKKKTNIDK